MGIGTITAIEDGTAHWKCSEPRGSESSKNHYIPCNIFKINFNADNLSSAFCHTVTKINLRTSPYIYIYIYTCVCVCVCARARA